MKKTVKSYYVIFCTKIVHLFIKFNQKIIKEEFSLKEVHHSQQFQILLKEKLALKQYKQSLLSKYRLFTKILLHNLLQNNCKMTPKKLISRLKPFYNLFNCSWYNFCLFFLLNNSFFVQILNHEDLIIFTRGQQLLFQLFRCLMLICYCCHYYFFLGNHLNILFRKVFSISEVKA